MKSLMRSLSGSKSSSDKAEAFQKTTKKADFQRIKDDWMMKCDSLGLPLNNKVLKELQKRIDSCVTAAGGKSKLDLKSMDLSDKQVKALLEVLAQAPVMAKLELDKNKISDEVSLLFYLFVSILFSYKKIIYQLLKYRVLIL